ncbi:hypothetical protein [Methylobacterium iners]|uniref:Antifreeze protein n=1 Tax=Methylobacterium iners TaxID=418707 RepID=A0ABQ4RZ12_9HYPH|nr:hypothetical protein [Methylobacterium iners]GJD95635.1 hypothetical protein OCOJLMKI_2848 [Methylobacterium iners]
MPVTIPRRLSAALVLSAALGLGSATAQADRPATGGRSWTDPPARSTPAASDPAPNPDKAEAPQKRVEDTRETKRAAAVATRKDARPARAKVAERRRATEPRMSRRVAQAPREREAPRGRAPVTVRYHYAPAAVAMGADSGFHEDERLRRIRQAEAAGFLVVRSRSVEFPDGRRLRTYVPYEGEDEDE